MLRGTDRRRVEDMVEVAKLIPQDGVDVLEFRVQSGRNDAGRTCDVYFTILAGTVFFANTTA